MVDLAQVTAELLKILQTLAEIVLPLDGLLRSHVEDHDRRAALLLTHGIRLVSKALLRPIRGALSIRRLALAQRVAGVARLLLKLPGRCPVGLVLPAHLLDIHRRLEDLWVVGDGGHDLQQHPEEEGGVLQTPPEARDDAVCEHDLMVVPRSQLVDVLLPVSERGHVLEVIELDATTVVRDDQCNCLPPYQDVNVDAALQLARVQDDGHE
mmetsp:Transcript_34179/g.94028  ORF Transcript_34179/g.94028 Transcript_34179/m.94028 type:complete len:210 (+) Transcript_34179:7307-7936(+)